MSRYDNLHTHGVWLVSTHSKNRAYNGEHNDVESLGTYRGTPIRIAAWCTSAFDCWQTIDFAPLTIVTINDSPHVKVSHREDTDGVLQRESLQIEVEHARKFRMKEDGVVHPDL
jgi:hypothetical protein